MDRIKILKLVIFLIAILVILRLFYWQFIAEKNPAAKAQNSESKLPATRGEILTSDNFPLVSNQQAFILYGKPQDLKEKPENIAKKIAPYLISEKFATREANISDEEKNEKEETIKVKESEIKNKLSNINLYWIQLGRKITLETKKKIEDYKLEGLVFENDAKRYYPEASLAAHILGFVGSDQFGDDTGYFGLEGFYNSELRGQDGRLGQEKDPFGFPILVGKYRPLPAKKGDSLMLNIDRTIQFIVENKLRDSVEKYGAKQGTVIVMEPTTGKILAMATYPTYEPSFFDQFDEKLFNNPSVGDTYEPGSTFKLITMSAALDLALVEPSTKCDVCSGPRQIGGYEISTWNKKYYPNSTMVEVIEHSDNVGMTFVADKLGIEKFYDYIGKFGFGKKTQIDLQEEAAGNIRNKNEWKIIDLATASFGQGIAVTPIQMVQAIGAIANRGKLISPRLVEKVINEDGSEQQAERDERQVISAKTAAIVTEMMVNAVENGEAKAFVPKGYKIAGKTGTAQIPVAGHYDPEKTIASFIGFAPSDNPRFVMLVRFTEPTSSIFGSETAAPTFFSIAKDIFNYLGIPPG